MAQSVPESIGTHHAITRADFICDLANKNFIQCDTIYNSTKKKIIFCVWFLILIRLAFSGTIIFKINENT